MTFNAETLPLTENEIKKQVQQALDEDLGTATQSAYAGIDVSASLIENNQQAQAQLICRETAILCGQAWFNTAMQLCSSNIEIDWHYQDGNSLDADTVVCELHGPAHAILTAERTAMNFLQTLSATASTTAQYVQQLDGTKCKLLDTRKTIPGLRLAQKYAVACGGGSNHRIGLYDMVLIKENHIHAAGSIHNAVTRARQQFAGISIEVEVENLDELQQAIECQVERVLLDNMDLATLKQAVALAAKKLELEASGNITLQTIRETAKTGVDYISTGAITKHVQAIDFSLRFVNM